MVTEFRETGRIVGVTGPGQDQMNPAPISATDLERMISDGAIEQWHSGSGLAGRFAADPSVEAAPASWLPLALIGAGALVLLMMVRR